MSSPVKIRLFSPSANKYICFSPNGRIRAVVMFLSQNLHLSSRHWFKLSIIVEILRKCECVKTPNLLNLSWVKDPNKIFPIWCSSAFYYSIQISKRVKKRGNLCVFHERPVSEDPWSNVPQAFQLVNYQSAHNSSWYLGFKRTPTAKSRRRGGKRIHLPVQMTSSVLALIDQCEFQVRGYLYRCSLFIIR